MWEICNLTIDGNKKVVKCSVWATNLNINALKYSKDISFHSFIFNLALLKKLLDE